MKEKYTKDTKLSEVMGKPETNKIIMKYKLPCLSCALAAYEAEILTLGMISKTYGIDLDEMLKELNEVS